MYIQTHKQNHAISAFICTSAQSHPPFCADVHIIRCLKSGNFSVLMECFADLDEITELLRLDTECHVWEGSIFQSQNVRSDLVYKAVNCGLGGIVRRTSKAEVRFKVASTLQNFERFKEFVAGLRCYGSNLESRVGPKKSREQADINLALSQRIELHRAPSSCVGKNFKLSPDAEPSKNVCVIDWRSHGGSDVGPRSGGGSDVGPGSGGGSDVGHRSGGGSDVGPRSGGGSDVGPRSGSTRGI